MQSLSEKMRTERWPTMNERTTVGHVRPLITYLGCNRRVLDNLGDRGSGFYWGIEALIGNDLRGVR